MIRIPRERLSLAIDSIFHCMEDARDLDGLRVIVPVRRDDAERALLAALSVLTRIGPAIAADTYFLNRDGLEWPQTKIKDYEEDDDGQDT